MALTEDRKSDRLVARLSPEDKETIEIAAELEGRSISSFAVQHLLAHAREVIAEKEVLRLNEEESRTLIQILNAPPREPSQSFVKTLKTYRKSVESDAN